MLMKRKYQQSMFYLFLVYLSLLVSCAEKAGSNKQEKQQESLPAKTKPGATGSDSLRVNAASVIFFEPDSIQLEKIRQITEDRIFKSNVHDFEFQSYTVKMYVKKNRPDLKVFRAKNFRYIVFVKSDNRNEVIDLDKIADAWGMYVFDPKKEPQLSDMMNVDTEIPRYFSK
jgi:hypothetical protein